MKRIRSRGEEIRKYILENIDDNSSGIAKLTASHFNITRQAVNKHLQRLKHEGALDETGNTRNRSYALKPKFEWARDYQITRELEEHLIWQDDLSKVIGNQPENVLDI